MAKITLLPEIETKAVTSTRPLMVNIKTKELLYSYYMPSLKFAGLFVPSTSFGPAGAAPTSIALPPPGSKIMMLLTLPGETTKHTMQGKVCWMTYVPTSLGAAPGVGVHFDDNEVNRNLRIKIENVLAGILGKSEVRTTTM